MSNSLIVLVIFLMVLIAILQVMILLKGGKTENRYESKDLSESFKLLSIEQENRMARSERQLEAIRNTLGISLDQKLKIAFSSVDERLANLHKGIGEMQVLAGEVGELRKVLTNVKNRGLFGELQLGTLLEDILPKGRYEEQFRLREDSKEMVDFAINLSPSGEKPTYLPIDAKFPRESYLNIIEASDFGTMDDMKKARDNFSKTLKEEAKSISSKYILPPKTTDFAIMFLPFESLYGEALENGVVDIIFGQYRVIVTGPSNMAALLSCIGLGYRNLSVSENASKVLESLRTISREFSNYRDVLEQLRKQLNSASATVEKLLTTRTNAIIRRLDELDRLDDDYRDKKVNSTKNSFEEY